MVDLKELFERYKEIKKQFFWKHKGYLIHHILSLEIICLVYGKSFFSYKQLLLLFATKRVVINTNGEKILFSMGSYSKRADYYREINFVRKGISGELLDLSDIKKEFKISFYNIYSAFSHIFFRRLDLSLKSKLLLWAKTVYVLNFIKDLEKNAPPNELKKFCSFCSSHVEEAILDYYFQKNGISTYTLQHGLYFIYDSYPIDSIAFENLPTQNFLCWGKYTKDEFLKYGIDTCQIKVTGYPLPTKKLYRKEADNNQPNILVLFARLQYHQNNMALVEILKELKKQEKVNIYLKLHPALNADVYRKIADENNFVMAENLTIQELMQKNTYDCSIVYNSTAYYDSYINNCISLRYKDEQADNSIDVHNDSFYDAQDLLKKIQWVKEKNTSQEFWDNTSEQLKYILGFGTNRYQEFLSVE